jgi:hypothetical protein
MAAAPKMKYGRLAYLCNPLLYSLNLIRFSVRLGTSGLKVSRIILGCMSYGDPKWGGNWVLPEEEGMKHIKAA